MIQTVTKTYKNLDNTLSHFIQSYLDGDLLDIIEIDESDGRVIAINSIITDVNKVLTKC